MDSSAILKICDWDKTIYNKILHVYFDVQQWKPRVADTRLSHWTLYPVYLDANVKGIIVLSADIILIPTNSVILCSVIM